MNAQGLAGVAQGPAGMTQGRYGAAEGATNGPTESMNRATNPGRKTMGLFSFLAPIASAIPGVGPLVGAGLAAIGGMQDQAKASAAANAAQISRGNALSGASDLAGRLADPDFSDVLNANKSIFSTFRANEGGVANPGALLKDIQGNALEKAIAGVTSDNNNALRSSAGILQGNAYQYGGIAGDAAHAAQSQGNPFSLFSDALNGFLANRSKAPTPSPDPAVSTDPSAGGIDLSSMIRPLPAAPTNPNSIAPPPSIGRGWGSLPQ